MRNAEDAKDQAAKAVSADGQKPERIDPARCTASGCPRPWSCDMGRGKLCSWHDVAPRIQWAEVTEDLRRLVVKGGEPIYPQLQRAPWVKEAAARARLGPKGGDLAGAMSARDHGAMSGREIEAQKRNTALMVKALAERIER